MGRTILKLNIRRTFRAPLFYKNKIPKVKGNRDMKHFVIKKCLEKATWHEDTLQCSCGRVLAVRYMVDKEVKLFTYGKFGKHAQKISARKDTQKITRKSDLLGNLGNEEWEEILRDIRQRKANT